MNMKFYSSPVKEAIKTENSSNFAFDDLEPLSSTAIPPTTPPPVIKVWVFFLRSIFQTLWKTDDCPAFLFFELETWDYSNFVYTHIFCQKLCKVWTTSENLLLVISKGSPYDFFLLPFSNKNSKGGTLIKWIISSLSDVVQTLHSLAQRRNMQVDKISSLQVKKQKIGATVSFSEGILSNGLIW